MKECVLNELAAKWERDAVPPTCEDGSEGARIANAISEGIRNGRARCAEELLLLIKLLGEKDGFDGRAMMAKGL